MVTELVREEDIFAMVGGMSSANCLAVKDYVLQRGIPWVNPGSSARIWTEPFNRATFSILPTSITAARVLTRYALAELGASRIAGLAEATPFGAQGLGGLPPRRPGLLRVHRGRAARGRGSPLTPGFPAGRGGRGPTIRRARAGHEIPRSGDGLLWRVERRDGGRWGRPEAAPRKMSVSCAFPRTGPASRTLWPRSRKRAPMPW